MRSVIAYYILIVGCGLCRAQYVPAMLEADHAFVRAVDAADRPGVGWTSRPRFYLDGFSKGKTR